MVNINSTKYKTSMHTIKITKNPADRMQNKYFDKSHLLPLPTRLFLSLFVSLFVSNFAQKLPNGFA